MAAITVRNLDDEVRDEPRLLAASHGHSMEVEVRSILTAAVIQGRQRPNALMDLSWAGRGGIEAEAEFAEPRGGEPPRVDFSGAEFG